MKIAVNVFSLELLMMVAAVVCFFFKLKLKEIKLTSSVNIIFAFELKQF